jgi:ribonucleoside-diphosphate reductase alpha chain
MDNDELAEVNPFFEKTAKERGFYSEDMMMEIGSRGTIQDIAEIPEDIKRVFVTAHDISPDWHIRMQAAFQKYTDNAVSKTVNFQREATQEDIKQVYMLAYNLGCKGVTVYRDGSRKAQVLNIEKVNREKKDEQEKRIEAAAQHQLGPRPRPGVVHGSTSKVSTGCGPLYVTINEDENGQLFEIFTNMGKAGGCASSQAEAISRLISLALRSGIKTQEIVKQLKGISCPMITWGEGGEKILSCADALAKAIEKYHSYVSNGSTSVEVKTMPRAQAAQQPIREMAGVAKIALCPECGGSVEYKEGCLTCPLCGYTKCL